MMGGSVKMTGLLVYTAADPAAAKEVADATGSSRGRRLILAVSFRARKMSEYGPRRFSDG